MQPVGDGEVSGGRKASRITSTYTFDAADDKADQGQGLAMDASSLDDCWLVPSTAAEATSRKASQRENPSRLMRVTRMRGALFDSRQKWCSHSAGAHWQNQGSTRVPSKDVPKNAG